MRLLAGALLLFAFSGCDLLLHFLLVDERRDEDRPDVCTSTEIPPTPPGATPEQVEEEVAALCN